VSNKVQRARITSAQALSGELRSPLAGVTNAAWNRLVNALMIDDDRGPLKGKPRAFNARTHAGGLGCFGTLPRRLVEIGVLRSVVLKDGKAIAAGSDKRLISFLANPILQYKAVVVSLKKYDSTLASPLPAGMSRSGVLALHHRLGPKALLKWQGHQEPSTVALFRRANGIF